MLVLIAPNAFEHSLNAAEAAKAIALRLRANAFRGGLRECPIADGRDGTAELLRARWGGRCIAATVRDPLGRRIEATVRDPLGRWVGASRRISSCWMTDAAR